MAAQLTRVQPKQGLLETSKPCSCFSDLAAKAAQDSREHIGGEARFIHAAIGASLERRLRQHPEVVMAHDQDLGFGTFFPEKARCFEAVRAGHADVEQNHIRLKRLRLAQRFRAIGRLSADLPGAFRVKEVFDSASNQLTVVNDEYAHRRSGWWPSAIPLQLEFAAARASRILTDPAEEWFGEMHNATESPVCECPG
jgi:hypothetical protein